MKILWLNWKDTAHPAAGGAEVVTEELIRRLARDGHEVTLIAGGFPGNSPVVERPHYRLVRLGNRYTVYWEAYRYARTHFTEPFDLVIDEMNTVPFFAQYWGLGTSVLFAHQMAREIWFYEMPFPIAPLGYWLEPAYLKLLSGMPTITVSGSTKRDLMRYGFEQVSVISEGITTPVVEGLSRVRKYKRPTMLTLGSLRPMKRTMDALRAFLLAKPRIADLQLIIAGAAANPYGEKVRRAAEASPYAHDIHMIGPVSEARKRELMQSSHLLLVSSVKEGWCLTVTEANSQGTPAVVYDVDGLRDSVRHNQTGIITAEQTPQALADTTVALLSNPERYQNMRHAAWEWSKEITFDKSYQDFSAALKTYGF